MKRLVLILSCFGLFFNAFGQLDPLYSQYQFNQQMINPAYSGAYEVMSLGLNSRFQWAGLQGAPVTNTLTASTSFGRTVGAGAVLIDDRLGINRTTEFLASGSYFINTANQTKIGFGVQLGFVNYRFDLTDLDPEVLNDPELRIADENYTKPNLGFGIFMMNPKYYIGFSVPRIVESKIDDGVAESTRYSRHYYLSAGYLLASSSFVDMKITSLLRMVEGQTSVDLGAMLILSNTIWAGFSIRNLNTVSISGQFQINQQFRVGYTFELPTTDLIYSSAGTHEIMIAYDLAVFTGQAVGGRYF